jgi:N-acetylmuramoyl-L-alanine amidase
MKSVRQGQSGTAVNDVQRRLHGLGYERPGFAEECDRSFFGEATRLLVAEFQERRGLRSTGEVDEATWRELVEASYRLGDRFLYLRSPYFRGDDVRELQAYLNSLGFHAGREDGIYGPDTDRAVRQFQRDSGLPVDGLTGASTIACLLRLKSVVKPTSVAEVKERLQDSVALPLEGRKVMLDAGNRGAAHCGLLERLRLRLESEGALPLVSPGEEGAGESERAALANRLEAEALLSVCLADPGSPARAFFFAGRNYVSPRGKRLSALLLEALGELGQGGLLEGKSFPLLRETRMTCVVLEVPAGGWDPEELAGSLVEALRLFWEGGPKDGLAREEGAKPRD